MLLKKLSLILFIIFSLLSICFAGYSFTPTSSLATLPDISVIGNILSEFGDHAENSFFAEEVELTLGGYIYPSIRADVVIALHKHGDHYDVELEEAYVTMNNLPGGFGIEIGKKLINFGKLNPVHGHHYLFVDEPMPLEAYLGDHGLNGNGISINYLLPTRFFLLASIGHWDIEGDDCDGHHHHHDITNAPMLKGANARLWSSFALNHNSELEIGASFIRAKGEHHTRDNTDHEIIDVYGLDITYRRVGLGFRRFLWQTELFHWEIERKFHDWAGNDDRNYDRFGFYTMMNYRWSQYWDWGFRYDRIENPANRHKVEVLDAGSLFLTHSLTETTKIRGQVKHEFEDSETQVYLQLLFGIGPHAHPLE